MRVKIEITADLSFRVAAFVEAVTDSGGTGVVRDGLGGLNQKLQVGGDPGRRRAVIASDEFPDQFVGIEIGIPEKTGQNPAA